MQSVHLGDQVSHAYTYCIGKDQTIFMLMDKWYEQEKEYLLRNMEVNKDIRVLDMAAGR